MTWLIARRAALESLQDRMTMLMSVFFAAVLPLGLLITVVRPLVLDTPSGSGSTLSSLLGLYLLLVGLMPAVSAVGIASGQFAGEKERGILTPLLASPASNLAIFGGKVLGAILPPMGYAVMGESVYLLGITLLLGSEYLALIPLALGLAMVGLVPAMTTFAATVASLISSRVRTFNAAQQLASLALIPVWGLMLGLALKLPEWGTAALFGALVGLVLIDALLIAIAAATWRREEVLSAA